MIKRAIAALTATARINPADHSFATSSSRRQSLGFALAGCLYMLRHQKNTRLQLLASAAAFSAALWLNISPIEWTLLILTVALVWVTEFINAAVEAAVNLSTPHQHPMAQVAKDVAAAAVLLAVIASLPIALLIFAPPLLAKLNAT